MIHYALRCIDGHRFDGWFASSDAFDTLNAAGEVACTVCGTRAVSRALMAPSIAKGSAAPRPSEPARAGDDAEGPCTDGPRRDAPSTDGPLTDGEAAQMRDAIRKLREVVAREGVNVGTRFPEEARRIHYGEAPERGIYGEAAPEEAKALLDEGIAILPLPVLPSEQN